MASHGVTGARYEEYLAAKARSRLTKPSRKKRTKSRADKREEILKDGIQARESLEGFEEAQKDAEKKVHDFPNRKPVEGEEPPDPDALETLKIQANVAKERVGFCRGNIQAADELKARLDSYKQ